MFDVPTVSGRAQRSEQEAFGDWVAPHIPAMRRVAASLVGPASADDVVQDALLRAWKRLGTFDEAKGNARPWLVAITVRQARRRLGRRRPADHLLP